MSSATFGLDPCQFPKTDLKSLLQLHLGAGPGMLLNTDGTIAAVNEAAAHLLDRNEDELIGAMFGEWAGLLEHADLDVVRVRRGIARPTSIRVQLVDYRAGDLWVTVSLKEIDPPPDMRLTDAVQQAIADLNPHLQGRAITLTQTQWPAVFVKPEVRGIVRLGLLLLSGMAGDDESELDLRGSVLPDGRVDLLFHLHLPRPASTLGVDPDFTPFAQLWSMGGRIHVDIDYPMVAMHLQFPATIQS